MKFTSWPLACRRSAVAQRSAQAQTEIQWWHSMSGALGDRRERARQQVQREPEGLQGRARSTRAPIPSR